MLVWFKSDAIIEYGYLFGLSKFLNKEKFLLMRMEQMPIGINYPTFLKIRYDNFVTRLLSCPLCFSVWMSIISCMSISIVWSQPKVLILIPIVCISSLIGYGTITSLLKLS